MAPPVRSIRSQRMSRRGRVFHERFRLVQNRYFSETYRCHFDPVDQVAVARGPLPDLTMAYSVSVNEEKEAIEKLKQKIGVGVLVRPVGQRRV
jgi:hypothetical protein